MEKTESSRPSRPRSALLRFNNPILSRTLAPSCPFDQIDQVRLQPPKGCFHECSDPEVPGSKSATVHSSVHFCQSVSFSFLSSLSLSHTLSPLSTIDCDLDPDRHWQHLEFISLPIASVFYCLSSIILRHPLSSSVHLSLTPPTLKLINFVQIGWACSALSERRQIYTGVAAFQASLHQKVSTSRDNPRRACCPPIFPPSSKKPSILITARADIN